MKKVIVTIMIGSVILLFCSVVYGSDLFVKSYYGVYDAGQKKTGFPSRSLMGPTVEKWVGSVPRKSYHIGVLFPHLKDAYWVSANYGIMTYAKELNLKITLFSAGAYINFGNQMAQLEQLVEREKVDGVVLSAVDYTKLDPFVGKVTSNSIPVVALINDIRAPAISAKSMVSFFEMGKKAGNYVIKDSAHKNIKVAFFPGPEKSGWAPDTYQGFLSVVAQQNSKGQRVTILDPFYGDTRPEVQRMRLEILNDESYRGVDYIVGNAVAAVEAVKYLKNRKDYHPKAKIVATYMTSDVFNEIEKGLIQAAPSDQIIIQCRIALDMVVKLLNGEEAGKDFPFRASPQIPLITTQNIQQYEYIRLFGPLNFMPIFSSFN